LKKDVLSKIEESEADNKTVWHSSANYKKHLRDNCLKMISEHIGNVIVNILRDRI